MRRAWVAAAWLATSQALAQSPAAITAVSVQGDGCAPGSTAVGISPDGQAFDVSFADYVVSAGGTTGRAMHRRSCAIDVTVRVAPGWTFALATVDYRGYVDLEAGARGQQTSSVSYPPRMALTRLATYDPQGPLMDEYQHHVDVPARYRILAPCTAGDTRRLLLRTDIGVMTRYQARALMTGEASDGQIVHRYGLAWQRCPY